MRILLSWLQDYVEWTGSARELAHVLTEVGLTVTDTRALDRGDAVLEIDVTSNRGDCLSHLGIAREIGAAMGQPCRTKVLPTEPTESGPEDAADLVAVEVEVPDLCPAYVARVLVGADPRAKTPAWIARRLERLGHRLVNPIVDVTNFVMLARGQPLHAFDRARLEGGRIVVRRSRPGESLVTLDGRRRDLPAGTLVIADASRPVAVAGVMGGRDSEVGPDTREVVLESARFAPTAVRAAADSMGLATEASARFSRRIDPAETEAASLRAMALLCEATGGRMASGAAVAGPGSGAVPPTPEVVLRYGRLGRLLGGPVAPEEIVAALTSLAFEVAARDRDRVVVRVPSHRGDVVLEEDLVEEVARVRGYGRIPVVLSLPVRPVPEAREARVTAVARGALAAAGFHEALTLPFVAPGEVDDASPWTRRAAVRVLNPVREEEPLLRRSLLGPLLRCLERNVARGVHGARLFEASRVFLPAEGEGRPEERRLLAGVLEGEYAEARGAADAVLDALGVRGSWTQVPGPASDHLPLDAARTAVLEVDGRRAALVGAVASSAVASMRVQRERLALAAFEMDLDALGPVATSEPRREPVPTHPVVSRDLSVVLPASLRWAEVEAAVRAAAGPLLRSLVPFDEYRGPGIPPGRRSLAFRMTFGAADRTLAGDEVETAVAAVAGTLESRLGGALRK